MMNNLRYLFLHSVILIMLNACAGKDYYVKITDDDMLAKDTAKILLTPKFANVSIASHGKIINPTTKGSYTPDTINFPQGHIVHMYVYKEGETPQTGIPIAFSMLSSYKDGALQPMSSQYGLKLPAGIYNIYAIGEYNIAGDQTPPFVNSNAQGGEKNGLANQCDYLWWKQENVHVSRYINSPIDIVFSHICILIQLNLFPATGDTITQIGSGTISTPSPTNCLLQMATGYITPSTTFSSSQTNLTLQGNIFYVNLVPMVATTPLVVMLSFAVNNGNIQWHSVNLPLPINGIYKQNNAYIYNLYLGPTKSEITNIELLIRE